MSTVTALMAGCVAPRPAVSIIEPEPDVKAVQPAGLTYSITASSHRQPYHSPAQAVEESQPDLLGSLDFEMSAPKGNPPLTVQPPVLDGKAIVVDQALQMMGVFEDGVEIRRLPVSTGRPTYDTYTPAWSSTVGHYVGSFESHTGGRADNAWYLYDATGAILIHSAPYFEVNGVKEYFDLDALGNYPASAGCVRLHPEDAQWLTDWGPQFAPFTITELPGPIEGLVASG